MFSVDKHLVKSRLEPSLLFICTGQLMLSNSSEYLCTCPSCTPMHASQQGQVPPCKTACLISLKGHCTSFTTRLHKLRTHTLPISHYKHHHGAHPSTPLPDLENRLPLLWYYWLYSKQKLQRRRGFELGNTRVRPIIRQNLKQLYFFWRKEMTHSADRLFLPVNCIDCM